MIRPFVSVLIDTYNHERFIEQAIASVLEQDISLADAEILVVDDGSTDRTPEIVRKFEPRVRLLRKENGGQASAFNAGIPECRGEIIAFLDGDDWWAKSKLRRVLETFEREPEVGIVGHGVIETYSEGRQRGEVLKQTARFKLDSSDGARIFRVRKTFLGTSRMSLRASVAVELLPVPDELRFEADEYLFTLAAASAAVVILPELLGFYRVHNSNLFQMNGFNEDGFRRKSLVLARLAEELKTSLQKRKLPGPVIDPVIEAITVEADQLRLMVDGGRPWETVKAELLMYRILYAGAKKSQWLFKCATLLPALLLPPRSFYKARRSIAANKLYLRFRRALVPIPEFEHTVRREKEDLCP